MRCERLIVSLLVLGLCAPASAGPGDRAGVFVLGVDGMDPQILDRLMAGENVPPESHLIEPLGIQTRQSSDTLAIDDPDVAAAVRFIREHASEGIDVSDVLARVSLSRRALESRFRRIINRTPHQEIMRVRIERVKMLLAASDFSLAEIAALTGFEHVEYLSVAFKREVGLSPRQYRKVVSTGST